MAKVSMINREKRRTKLVAKYAKKRAELKAIITNPNVDFEVQQDDFRTPPWFLSEIWVGP